MMESSTLERRGRRVASRVLADIGAVWVSLCAGLGLWQLLLMVDSSLDAMRHPEGPFGPQHPFAIEALSALAAGLVLVLLMRRALPLLQLLLMCAMWYFLLDIPLWRAYRPFYSIPLLYRPLPGLVMVASGMLIRGGLQRSATRCVRDGGSSCRYPLLLRSVVLLMSLLGALAVAAGMSRGDGVGARQVACTVISAIVLSISAAALGRSGRL